MARHPKVTQDLLNAWVSEGRGFGWAETYKSWMRLNRRNASPVSTQVSGYVPPFVRECHFFCRSEFLIAILFAWLGAWFREQFPIWPWPHPHPLTGINPNLDPSLQFSEGMQAICRDVGIDHGYFIGTRVLYVWTLDLVVSWTPLVDVNTTVVVSIKPIEADRFKDPDPLCRELEKLEAERRYAGAMCLPYFVLDRTRFPGPLLGQLEWLSSAAYPLTRPYDVRVMNEFLQQHGPALGQDAPANWISRLQVDYRASKELSDYVVQHCLWHQIVDCDLGQRINMLGLPIPGGRKLRQRLTSQFVSDVRHA